MAISKGFALARHGFIDGFDTWDKMTMQKYWKQNPMWAEGNWSYADLKNQKTHGSLDENLDVMLEWHSNYGHFYMDAESYKRAMREDQSSFARGLQSGGLGYRLVPTKMSWREELPAGRLFVIRQTWVNRNVGRLYLRHPLKLYLTDSEGNEKFSEVDRAFDETSWVQGESYAVISIFHLPKDLAAGVYDVRIALVDGSGKPRIRLAVQGEDSQMRHKLGIIRIAEPDVQVPCDKARCP